MSTPTTPGNTVASVGYPGPAVNVVTWFLGVTIVLAVLARFVTKCALSQSLYTEDAVLAFASIFSIGTVIATTVGVSWDNEDHRNNTPGARLGMIEKAVYAGDLLYILTLAFSKESILLLFRRITPVYQHLTVIWALLTFTALWGLASALASIVQCHVPRVWQVIDGKCFDQLAFWNAFGALNLLTEVLMIAAATWLLWNVRLGGKRKIIAIGVFFGRVLVIGAIIAEIYFRNKGPIPTNTRYPRWTVLLCIQFVQALSIVTACLPYLKPFFSSLQANMIETSDFSKSGESRSVPTEKGAGGGGLKSVPASLRMRLAKSLHSPVDQTTENKTTYDTENNTFEMNHVGLAVSTPTPPRGDVSDIESQHSRAQILHPNGGGLGYHEHSVT